MGNLFQQAEEERKAKLAAELKQRQEAAERLFVVREEPSAADRRRHARNTLTNSLQLTTIIDVYAIRRRTRHLGHQRLDSLPVAPRVKGRLAVVGSEHELSKRARGDKLLRRHVPRVGACLER